MQFLSLQRDIYYGNKKNIEKLSILDFKDSVLLKKDSPDTFIARGI